MIVVVLASIAGALLFAWPLTGAGLPPSAVSGLVVAASLGALALTEMSARRLDSRRLALLAAVAAIDSALRLLVVTGILGWSPVFFLVLCAGYVYGAGFGFLCGSVTMLVSALVTGGVGPWLPYEMLGVGWVGALAGVVTPRRPRATRRRDVLVLAIIGTISGWLYGAALDLWDWTTFYRGAPDFGWVPGLAPAALLGRFGRFYLATSLLWDTARAAGNALSILLLGAPVIAALQRLRLRLGFRITTEDDVLGVASAGAAAASPAPGARRPSTPDGAGSPLRAAGAVGEESVDLVGETRRGEAQLEQ